ncbi:Alb1-domain-containing protein [Tricladium varicosporioides]|nr:Alb1-domain-containing protein [Hymenoscyphus varicosporioides]
MAKTAPNKAKKASISIHSRAAKRASSPSIDTDKSLKDVKLPTDSKATRPSVLAVHQGAGVSKKSKNGRKSILSAKARRRQEKGADRAEAFMDKKETKVEKSKARGRTVQERSKAWEELNKKMLVQRAKEEGERIENESWVDEEDDGMEEDIEIKDTGVTENIPLPGPVEDEEEIL